MTRAPGPDIRPASSSGRVPGIDHLPPLLNPTRDNVARIRRLLSELDVELRQLGHSRELSLAATNFQTGALWVAEHVQRPVVVGG